jgi:hypothetical protein
MENSNRRAFEENGDEEEASTSRDEIEEIQEIPSIDKEVTSTATQTVSFDFVLAKQLKTFSTKTDDYKELNYNDYATRKTLAQGMLDLAIFSANAAQLRRVVIFGTTHMFYYLLMITIIVSICLQVTKKGM